MYLIALCPSKQTYSTCHEKLPTINTGMAEISDWAGLAKNFKTVGSRNIKDVGLAKIRKQMVAKTISTSDCLKNIGLGNHWKEIVRIQTPDVHLTPWLVRWIGLFKTKISSILMELKSNQKLDFKKLSPPSGPYKNRKYISFQKFCRPRGPTKTANSIFSKLRLAASPQVKSYACTGR